MSDEIMTTIQRSKARKKLFTLPNNLQSKSIRAMTSEDLRNKYKVTTLRINKGDNVKIMRGEYSGIEAKVTKIDLKLGKINVDGVKKQKIAGGDTPVQIHPSNVMLTSLNMADKLRKKKLS